MSPSISARLLRTQSDERLAAAAARGHERAFEALVVRYRKPLLRYARRLGLAEARSEDVVQQALMRAWVSLQGGAQVRDVSAWLYRIVHNAAIDVLRGPSEAHEQLSDAAGDVAAAHADPESAVAVRETLAGIAALPGLQREALLCTAVEGRSNEQAAVALGVSAGAVRGLVYRARVALRAGATAITPPFVLGWAVGTGRRGSGLAAQMSGAEAAGAGAGVATGILLKSGAVLLTAGAIVVGAATVRHAAPTNRRATVAVSIADGSRGAGGVPASARAAVGGRRAGSPGQEQVGRAAVPGTSRGAAGVLAVGDGTPSGGARPTPAGTDAPTSSGPRQPGTGVAEAGAQETHFNAAASGAGTSTTGTGTGESSEPKPAPGAGAEGGSKSSGADGGSDDGAGGSNGGEGARDEGEGGTTGSSGAGSSDDGTESSGEHSAEGSSPGTGSDAEVSDDRHSTAPGQAKPRDN